MTGFDSKRRIALDRLDDDDIQIYAQPEQEPVQEPVQFNCTVIDDTHPNGIPLNQWGQQPPKRPWIGLTDEDCKGMSAGDKVVAMWANRTVKEKNT